MTGEVELPMLHHATALAELVEQRDACGRRVAWTEKPSDAWLRQHLNFICGCPVRSARADTISFLLRALVAHLGVCATRLI